MNDTIDRKPPTISADPPELPPYLRKRRKGNGRFIIVPDLRRLDMTLTRFDNMWTVHFFWMVRLDLVSGECIRTHVNTRLYRSWLETYETNTGVPPHIACGGPVAPIDLDVETINRWVQYVRKTFC